MFFTGQKHIPVVCFLVMLSMSNALLFAQPLPVRAAMENTAVSNDNPCAVVKPYAYNTTLFSTTFHYQTALQQMVGKIEADPAHEFIVSFGRDTLGQVMVSPIAMGNKSNAVVPAVLNGFADLHNHPKHTPPSSGDLYGLLMKNRRNSQYTTRYILADVNAVYALVVTDTIAACNFLKNYAPQQAPGFSPLFPDELLNEYREIKHRFGVSEELAMAYLLEKYAAGVVLMKQNGKSDFVVIRTSKSGTGDAIIFMNTSCQ